MSYQQTVNEIRDAAESVNPTGRFIHGRIVDASQQNHGTYPLIVLYPFQTRPGVDPEFFNNSDILMGFWQQDSAVSTPEDREAIIAQMDALSDAFIAAIELNSQVRFSGLVKEAQYFMYQGTLSGYAIRFTYMNVTPC